MLVRRSEAKRITGGDPFDLPGFGRYFILRERGRPSLGREGGRGVWAAADVHPRVKIKCFLGLLDGVEFSGHRRDVVAATASVRLESI